MIPQPGYSLQLTGSALRIAFNSGTIEGFFDDLTIYDGPDNTGTVLFNNNADGIQDFAGLIFQSTGDSLFLEVDSDGSVSCQSGSRLEWDFDVFLCDMLLCKQQIILSSMIVLMAINF